MTEPYITPRAAESNQPDDNFVELFARVYDIEKTQLLAPEYRVAGVDGTTRNTDFALKSAGRLVAFEIHGYNHPQPLDFGLDDFEDDLHRQNTFIQQGWHNGA